MNRSLVVRREFRGCILGRERRRGSSSPDAIELPTYDAPGQVYASICAMRIHSFRRFVCCGENSEFAHYTDVQPLELELELR